MRTNKIALRRTESEPVTNAYASDTNLIGKSHDYFQVEKCGVNDILRFGIFNKSFYATQRRTLNVRQQN